MKTIGLIGGMSWVSTAHYYDIINRETAARLGLPAIYWSRFFPQTGGLVSYGPNSNELHRQSALYVDRILRGEQPADLPVQEATRYETVLNLRTARSLGLAVPAEVAALADDVLD